MQTLILILLTINLISTIFLIIINTKKMSPQLDGIIADLQSAQAEAARIAEASKSQIAALSDAPTPEDIAALKSQSEALLTSLKGIDSVAPVAQVAPVDLSPEVNANANSVIV
jgi:hypothetical protein